jgi:DNA polymerase III epsilon subunit-like protein
MKLYVIDTESTGVSKTDQVIQYASIEIPEDRASLLTHSVTTPIFQQLKDNTFQATKAILDIKLEHYNPTVKINPHAYDVHGISKIFLLKYPSVSTFRMPKADILIGHNTIFDTRLIAQTDPTFDIGSVKVICTMRLAKAIEKISGNVFGFESYSLSNIFKFFYPQWADLYQTQLHNALGDTEMCLLILVKLWENFPFITNLSDLQEYFFNCDGTNKKSSKK